MAKKKGAKKAAAPKAKGKSLKPKGNKAEEAKQALAAGVDPTTGKTLSEADIQAIADRIIQGSKPARRPAGEQPSKNRNYYARRPFGYEGVELDREQVLRLVGAANDEKLLRLGYINVLPEDATLHECRHCPAKFLSASARNAHGDRRHAPPKPVPTMEPRRADETEQEFDEREAAFKAQVASDEDREIEREEEQLNKIAPLHMDQTTATREA